MILAQESVPLADGLDKWLGNIHSSLQIEDHERYWNQITPENSGKWGSVEPVRDQMNWAGLDAAYEHAKTNGIPFRFHVLVWGAQQPGWIDSLPQDEQLEEIEEWFRAVAERYPDIDYLEVVNEPLHQPPSYRFALAGPGGRGWDWVVNAFKMAREIFPAETELVINDYGILNDMAAANRYRQVIELLQAEDLIDGICVQGHAFNTRPGQFRGKEVLDLLGETGLPIQVSEMDVDGNPNLIDNIRPADSDQNQLEDMQRIFPVLWEHEAVIGITMWGWRFGLWRQAQEANLVRQNGAERPALEWLREYLERVPFGDSGIGARRFDPRRLPDLTGNYPNPFQGNDHNPVHGRCHRVRVTLTVLRSVRPRGRHARGYAGRPRASMRSR